MTQIKIVEGNTAAELETNTNAALKALGNVSASTALYHTDKFYMLIEYEVSAKEIKKAEAAAPENENK